MSELHPRGPRIGEDESVELEVLRQVPGRVVLAEGDGSIHLGRGYHISRSEDDGVSWTRVASLPRARWRGAAEISRLACRLLRQEVRALARLPDGGYVAANRDGVFFAGAGDPVMRRAEIEAGELAVMPPMRLTVGPGGVVVCGEYGCPDKPRPVRLYVSRDGGCSFQMIHTLEAGNVYHIHNVLWDEHEGHYWVFAGDWDPQAGIGRLSADFQRFEWFVKGEQRYRAVHAFDFGDRLVYATDTEKEVNGLISLDKKTGYAERLRDFEGSCIYACRFGGVYAITTTVEPSNVNPSQHASLWLSRDGERWKRAWRSRKDRWNADYFQFGSLVLPVGTTDREVIFFSGQAVERLDGRTAVARIAAGTCL